MEYTISDGCIGSLEENDNRRRTWGARLVFSRCSKVTNAAAKLRAIICAKLKSVPFRSVRWTGHMEECGWWIAALL